MKNIHKLLFAGLISSCLLVSCGDEKEALAQEAAAALEAKGITKADYDQKLRECFFNAERPEDFDKELFKQLILAGANPNIPVLEGKEVTPIFLLSKAGMAESLQVLVDAGVDVNAVLRGRTPLMEAVSGGNPKAAEILIKAGANVNAVNEDGRSVLWRAIVEERPDMVRLLLENGADAKAKDPQGRSMMEVAMEEVTNQQAREAIVRMLVEHGVAPETGAAAE